MNVPLHWPVLTWLALNCSPLLAASFWAADDLLLSDTEEFRFIGDGSSVGASCSGSNAGDFIDWPKPAADLFAGDWVGCRCLVAARGKGDAEISLLVGDWLSWFSSSCPLREDGWLRADTLDATPARWLFWEAVGLWLAKSKDSPLATLCNR